MSEQQASVVAKTGFGLEEFLANAPADAVDTASPEEKAEEVPEENEPEEESLPLAASEEDGEETETAAEEDPKSEDTQAGETFDWESNDNPYKRRYLDTSYWTQKVNQELAALRQQSQVMEKKLDGTYDPSDEVVIDPQDAVKQQELSARVNASVIAANQMFGEANVQQTLFADDAPFRAFDDDPVVQGRVLAAEAPAVEAMRFLAEHQFFEKYGREPDAIVAKIREELRAEVEESVAAKVKEQFNQRLAKSKKQVNGVANATGTTETADRKGNTSAMPSLGSLVNNGFV